jgi:Domain of unknown function (DUF1992)
MERPAEADQEEGVAPPRLTRGEALQDGVLGERAIREAMARGAFDNLPGHGKPLRLDPRASTPEGLVAGILKEANVVPEWIELAGQIDTARSRLAREVEEAGAARREHEAAAEARLAAWRAAAAQLAQRTTDRGWQALVRRLRERPPSPARLEAALREYLAEAERRRARRFADHLRLAHETNHRIRRFNPIVPTISRQRPLLNVDALAAAFVAAWPALRLQERDAQPALAWDPVEPPRPEPPPDPSETVRLARDPARLVALSGLVRGRRPPPIG